MPNYFLNEFFLDRSSFLGSLARLVSWHKASTKDDVGCYWTKSIGDTPCLWTRSVGHSWCLLLVCKEYMHSMTGKKQSFERFLEEIPREGLSQPIILGGTQAPRDDPPTSSNKISTHLISFWPINIRLPSWLGEDQESTFILLKLF